MRRPPRAYRSNFRASELRSALGPTGPQQCQHLSERPVQARRSACDGADRGNCVAIGLGRKRERRQCRNRIVCGGCRRISGGEIGTLGARRIDKPIANTGQDPFTRARRGRERRVLDCQSGKSSGNCPPKLKRRVHPDSPAQMFCISRNSIYRRCLVERSGFGVRRLGRDYFLVRLHRGVPEAPTSLMWRCLIL